LKDEINADTLGLGNQTALSANGVFNELLNIGNRIDFEELILKPLYQKMNIASELELQKKQYEVLEILENLSVKEVYENQGFNFTTDHPTRAISRGIVALANQGPDSSEAAFFITLGDSPWLTGKHTVIGQVIEGMEVVDAIGEQPIDPLRSSQLSTVIYSIRRVDQAD
jgi:cyclophilin family peptidyl-prolyl cis-trans isomerase